VGLTVCSKHGTKGYWWMSGKLVGFGWGGGKTAGSTVTDGEPTVFGRPKEQGPAHDPKRRVKE